MNFFLIFTVIIFPLIILRSIKKIDCETTYLLGKQETSVIRGISVIFIIESRFLAWAIEMGAEVNKILQLIIGQLGGIGVLLFFFVSGYGIYVSYAKEKPGWNFIRKRLENVYIPYVFIKLIMLFLFCLLGEHTGSLENNVLNILTLEDWFIRVIVLQYISFFVLKNIGKKGRQFIVASIIVDCILSFIFIVEQRPLRWFNALWLFTVGFVVAEQECKIIECFKRNFVIKCMGLFVAFFTSGALFAYYKEDILLINVFKIVSGSFLCLWICGILRKICLKSKILSYIGRRSIYYYIVHINMWELLRGNSRVGLKLVLAISATIVLSELLFFSYEKLKKSFGSKRKLSIG